MNRIDEVEIVGFWGNRTFHIKFHEDVNFFIGVNGSGKTTVINIIAAALSADFETLDKLPFESITIKLSEVGGKKKPSIVVEKKKRENSPYLKIAYKIREKASSGFVDYSLDDFEEERLLRGRIPRSMFYKYPGQFNRGLISKIGSLVNVNWLSIHRSSNPNKANDEDSYESSVDQKLNELNSSLVRYFSSLSSKVTDELEKFQKKLIVSILTARTEDAVLSSVQKFDQKKEKDALSTIFEKLGISADEAKIPLKKHFLSLDMALNKLEKQASLTLADLNSIISAYRSHIVVQDWKQLLAKQSEILSPKETFLRVLNSLFQRKEILVNEQNVLCAITDSGKKLSINEMSSGEKQLLIILGEGLLQQKAPWVYIADEPELSLHVSWQECLINNLREINPEAQIICATHSPDIVGSFSKNVFDMEKIIT